MSEKKYLDHDGLIRFSNKILKLISGVENGSTASKQYLAGQYFIRSGDLKVATQTINQGGTFSATNCTSTDIGGELSDLNGSVDSIIAMISGVEDSTTASKAYTAGEFLIYNGKLYEVTADIASGGTIVLTGASQNVSESTVGGELSELKGAINDIQGQITVYVETGNNATRNYGIGEYIVWNGDLYRVKSSISSGNAFTSGNVESTTIGAELRATPPTNPPTYNDTTVSDGSISLTKISNLIIIDGYVVLNGSVAGNNATLATLPTGFTPASGRAIRAYATYNGTSGFYSFYVDSNGSLKTGTGGGTFTGNVYFPSLIIRV